MNMPKTMKMKAASLRLSKCSTAGAAEAIGRIDQTWIRIQAAVASSGDRPPLVAALAVVRKGYIEEGGTLYKTIDAHARTGAGFDIHGAVAVPLSQPKRTANGDDAGQLRQPNECEEFPE